MSQRDHPIEPDDPSSPVLSGFSRPTRLWFNQNFAAATEPQTRGWPVIAGGAHVLITAPTGSGKTLAAFLSAIDRLSRAEGEAGPGVRVVYVSPLKALVYDIERNLRAPLAGIRRAGEGLGETIRLPRVAIRTGDTSQQERQRQLREPAEILVTTPESLFLILGSKAAAHLAAVHTLIVDELHALAPTKRGAHLALTLERLVERCGRDPQRIGLSATVRPLDEAARYLAGDRPIEIVDASAAPRLDLRVVVPVPDMERPPEPTPEEPQGGSILAELYGRAVARPPQERGIWSAIYPALLAEIRSHRSTILFTNSRGLCERICQRLNELAGEELVRAHHGSVSHEQRAEIEEGLKGGVLRALVATSSLEMGIDMGAVDQVLLVESPGSVARGLQRVGRAGHGVGEVSTGRIFPKFRGDLLECAVVASRMLVGEIEPFRMPRNALDVLAQQVAALCLDEDRVVDEVHRLVRRAGPYRDLSRSALEAVLDMLSGRYPSSDFAELRPLLSWDRASDILSARRGAPMVVRLNAGTIPDRGSYGVFLGEEGPRVGELDEEMVFETKVGDNILLGASTWRVDSITRDRVLVSPAPGEPGRLPFWRGDGLGRPMEVGRAIGAFCRQVAGLGRGEAAAWIQAHTPLDGLAAGNLAAYIQEQQEATGQVPSDRMIVVERFRDELGDWRVCILSPFGARIHAAWAMALQWHLGQREGFEIQVMYTDDGIVVRYADGEDLPTLDDLLPDPEDVEARVTEQLADTALFSGLFRENAARSLLMPRRSPRGRQPLWAQRLKAQHLLAAVRRYPSFPIVLETYRQALSDVLDLPGLSEILRDVRSRAIRVHEAETPRASPFARSLVFAYVAAYIYEQDSPIAERRAQALTLDRGLLGELLGQAELRELIDAEVLRVLERELQHLDRDRQARDADELHDLLRRLGDLSPEEVSGHCVGDPLDWLRALEDQRRAVRTRVAGETRWIAAEDAGLYRDALGIVPPPGLPDSYLQPIEAPLDHLLRRYARVHGPFPTKEAAARFGLRPAQAEPPLRLLEIQGVLIRGEIRPMGSEPEWCDAEVLRRLRRRTLARLRQTVAPVDAAALGRFLPRWHGIGEEARGASRLLEALVQLEGLPVPWSALDRVLLPARVTGYRSEELDLLAATGQIVWVGRGALGPRDGRIAVYRRGQAGALLDPVAEDSPPSDLHRRLLDRLRERGACFFIELAEAVGQGGGAARREGLEAALWDLVWAGRITNDTFAPLRNLGERSPPGGRARVPALAGGRWSLVSGLACAGSDTERLLARALMLIERYGVVSLEAVQGEGLTGGFGPVYRVLKQMEEAGRVRRGYFVEGLSGAQFAMPGAVDRLRGARVEEVPVDGYPEAEVTLLAAIDPATPYGVLVPWPEVGGGAPPKRSAGAWVILVAGKPVLYLAPGGRHLASFPASLTEEGGELGLALAALQRLPRIGRRRLLIRMVDGEAALTSPLRARMRSAGFEADYDALAQVRWA
jgi:ATP-dependent helicase Lhr and Lhr-like helicase